MFNFRIKIVVILNLSLLLTNCTNNDNKFQQNEIKKIQLSTFNAKFFLTDNIYELNEDYKKPGIHNLKFTVKDIEEIKQNIISEKIYELPDSLKYIKSCEKVCWVEIDIEYINNKKQKFRIDNSNYKSNFPLNLKYKKLSNLEALISRKIMDKRLEMDAKIELM
ncbi:hypothetical protein Q73A0000_05725 [Kaistella flava (ex Peng et al. 2021)]|uniref:Uncharacterized protein n=1 Tax=Kaistella flava (ex Peng et al. 2021) TaxID=2038776 RepID=A0A7M2Y8D4_9FLAO|nr:hypothetical protein [Kaistella flava (ex Peng et al. 2021)]QOW09895.1 hypothetical protein Q73A0000_05725 [Kaistella flava (ex Peng et al. 2021)]